MNMITSLEFKNAVAQAAPTNHVIAVDTSGSMYDSLPKIRQHLKSNLATLVKPGDTVSVLYFSSKGQCGAVFVGEPVRNLTDLSNINNAIDRYLKPTGLTGFVEPLQLAFETVQSIKNGNTNSLAFLTDGYDNQWTEEQILSKAQQISKVFDNVTIIEYGYYCNRPLLEKMASVLNATHVFAEGYQELEPQMDNVLKSGAAKRIKISVPKYTSDIAYVDGGTLVFNQVKDFDETGEGDTAYIPEDVKVVWALNKNLDAKALADTKDEQLLYVCLLMAVRDMNQDLVWDILKLLGDVYLIKKYNNCFTKQDYSVIKADIEKAVLEPEFRFLDGVNYNLVPKEDAFTVLDLLNELADNDAKLLTSSPYFSYNRIGRGTVQREDDTVDKLAEEMASAKTKEERKEIAAKMVSANEWTPEFEKVGEEPSPMHALVYNETRPNVSVRTTVDGKVAVPESIRKDYPTLPESIPSHIYRNYTIIKDGIINIKTLPVALSPEIATYLQEQHEVGMFEIPNDKALSLSDGVRSYVIDLMSLPVVNRAMVKGIQATEFFNAHVELQRQKALTKVLKFYREQLIGKVNALGLAKDYGDEAAAFLSGKGIRDYGFSPAVDSVEATDFYYSRELSVKIAGLSSLPSVDATIKKFAENEKAAKDGKKLKTINAGDRLMKEAIDHYTAFVTSPVVTGAKSRDTIISTWIKDETQASIDATRQIQLTLSKLMYGIVAGHGWFSDLSFEEPTMVINNRGEDYTVTASLETKEIKV
ncbi:hypothetical protein HWB57_gp097 [Erwinia phage vB_EamM-Bue1]|uniref:VWFA domain-containing protein n=1 Tax=Erwinia phage vB_EamM-Bue1 TaxID=2099338 RepID=A0A2P1JUA4_9CAUD|nr:hypothetical protein HWB57_gp097 [Erwinia phage vB_EamM-Bue1]AVO22937.1 hypothetical protein [Erwinia phage vB_EamM-Bue1]